MKDETDELKSTHPQLNRSISLEKHAASIVDRWLSGTGSRVIWVDQTGTSDFRIVKNGHVVGLGEVKADIFDKLEEFRQNIMKRRLQVIDCDESVGSWSLHVTPDTKLKGKERLFRALASTLYSSEVTSMDSRLRVGTDNFEVVNFATKLGVTRAQKLQVSGISRIYIHEPSLESWIPEECPPLSAWLEKVIGKHAGKTEVIELQDNQEISEKHYFIWIDSLSPVELFFYSQEYPERLPDEWPSIPEWVTHLWIGIPWSFNSTYQAWLFRPGLGWEHISGGDPRAYHSSD